MKRPGWRAALLLLLIGWHVVAVGEVVSRVWDIRHGGDLATFRYAAIVAAEGGDPYDRAALGEAARRERTRREVYPLLYPPTFLPLAAPLAAAPMREAYRASILVGELAVLAIVLACVGDRRRDWLPVVGVVALSAAVPDNLRMGQANLAALAAAAWGIAAVARGRGGIGGALVGVAVGVKLVPALAVAGWATGPRWRAAVGAGLALGALGAASILLYGPSPWVRFVSDVLPSILGGDHNGLDLAVVRLGNHGLGEWWARLLPGPPTALSTGARVGLAASAAAILGGLAWLWRRPAAGPDAVQARAAASLVVPVLLATFAWEHHLVWAIPAWCVVARAAFDGRLPRWTLPLVAVAFVGWAVDLRLLATAVEAAGPWLGPAIREAKTVGLLTALGGAAWLGAQR
jgi:hypothetical protein